MRSVVRIALAVEVVVITEAPASPRLAPMTSQHRRHPSRVVYSCRTYGVFDFPRLQLRQGNSHPDGLRHTAGTLKHDATRAAKRASGVDQVIDKVEELPVS